jgi:hypothetical protein
MPRIQMVLGTPVASSANQCGTVTAVNFGGVSKTSMFPRPIAKPATETLSVVPGSKASLNAGAISSAGAEMRDSDSCSVG